MISKSFLSCVFLMVFAVSILGFNYYTNTESRYFKNAQRESTRDIYSDSLLPYIKYNHAAIALRHASIIDGTGLPVRKDQTIIIKYGKFYAVGEEGKVEIPRNAVELNMRGKTIIPGFVGMHNHLHIPGFPDVGEVAAKLYLASGVTTIQTCGATNTEKELWLSDKIEKGEKVGPNIIPSAPFITGKGGNPNMIIPRNSKHLQDTLGYWLERGIKWIKVYRNIHPNDLERIIHMAHENDAKVRGHLCSVTFEEATQMGIDGIEHGLNSASDFRTNKAYGICGGGRAYMDELNLDDQKVKAVQHQMINKGVFLTSTLSIYEASVPNRIHLDDRSKSVMSPYLIGQYEERLKGAKRHRDDMTRELRLKRIMAFERKFFEMGGLLCSGVDAGRHILPGFGDQRNFELLTEAGFSTVEAIQVMTGNGAKALERNDIGSIGGGKKADFIILDGALVDDPAAIYKINTVFKNGLGYDPKRLIEDSTGKFGEE